VSAWQAGPGSWGSEAWWWSWAALTLAMTLLAALAFHWWLGLRRELDRLARLLDEAQGGNVRVRFHSRAWAVRPLAERFNRLVRTLHDIETERRREETRRRQFVAAISHDLRTPLTAVLGYLEAVLTGAVEAQEERRYLETAYAKGKELRDTLDRFFEWARLDLDVADLPAPRINLAERLRQVLIEFYPAVHERAIDLEVDLPEEAWVYCHPDLVARVGRNLVQNALQHARGLSSLEISLRRDGDQWVLKVADDGDPVPDEVLTALFTPFQRRPGSPGAGLGLAISRHLARAWGGDLTVARREPRGLEFTVHWPRAQPAPGEPASGRP